jgi:cysteinyl-tRNA synthetase
MRWDAKFEVENEIIESTGYPGWHLECSVMGQKYLGEEFDIHAGGKDHIFPHHPNERAQCFAATGAGQARYWLHNEFINIEGEKMSKSEGNFYTVRDLLEDGYSGDAIRLYLISSHYRSETDFSKEGLEKAEKELKRVRRTVKRLREGDGSGTEFLGLEEKFEEEMDDDLNTARAKQVLMEAVNGINSAIQKGEEVDVEVANTLESLFGILGVDVRPQASEQESEMADLLLELRENARGREDYEESDRIRNRLQELGFDVEDTDEGGFWVK